MDTPEDETARFSDVLKRAIQDRGLSLERVRYHLAARGHDVSVATLSYWQSGRSLPEREASVAALADLERVLGTAPGVLSGALRAAKGRRESVWPDGAGSRVPVFTAEWMARTVEMRGRLAAGMGLRFPGGAQRLSVQVSVDVAGGGYPARRRVRKLLRGRGVATERVPIAVHEQLGVPGVQIVGESNCTVSEVVTDVSAGVTVAALELDRPLLPGEDLLVDYRVDTHEQAPAQSAVWHHFDEATHLFVVDLRFAGAEPPAWTTCTWSTGGADEAMRLPVVGAHQGFTVTDIGPGPVAVTWW